MNDKVEDSLFCVLPSERRTEWKSSPVGEKQVCDNFDISDTIHCFRYCPHSFAFWSEDNMWREVVIRDMYKHEAYVICAKVETLAMSCPMINPGRSLP